MEESSWGRRALVVVSHPDPASLNHALARRSVAVLESMGFATDVCDLYADGFDPVIPISETRGEPTADPLTRAYIGRLTSAEVLVAVHPNFWGAPPAMMKGWMDRVFAPGSAYAFEKVEDRGDVPRPLLRIDTAFVFNTSNTDGERERSEFGDPLERIWKDCLLRPCGVRTVKRTVFRIVATSSPEMREGWLREVERTIADGVRV